MRDEAAFRASEWGRKAHELLEMPTVPDEAIGGKTGAWWLERRDAIAQALEHAFKAGYESSLPDEYESDQAAARRISFSDEQQGWDACFRWITEWRKKK